MLHRRTDNRDLYLKIRGLAREMRKKSTRAEDYFWEKVRDRRLLGLKWNRHFILQCPVDPDFIKYYIADFHCHQLKLVVELDGQIHLKQEADDLIRTERLCELGFNVIRFLNEQVINHWDEVENCIREYMQRKKDFPEYLTPNPFDFTENSLPIPLDFSENSPPTPLLE